MVTMAVNLEYKLINFHLKHFRFRFPTDFVSLFPRGHLVETKQRRHVQFGKLIPGMKKNYREKEKKTRLWKPNTNIFHLIRPFDTRNVIFNVKLMWTTNIFRS